MKISVNREVFLSAIKTASRAAATSSTLPILHNILLSAEDRNLKVAGTNLETGIVTWVDCQMGDEGEITLPARLLGELVGNLPSDDVLLSLDNDTQTVTLECGKYTTKIKGLPASEFPIIQTGEGLEIISSWNGYELKRFIELALVSSADDNSRPILQGVLFQIRDGLSTLAAADGFRLSVVNPNEEDVSRELVIPAASLAEVVKVFGDNDVVNMSVSSSGKIVVFWTDSLVVTTQTLEGRFPDYNQIIPHGNNTRCEIDRLELLKAVRVCQLFARDSANIVKFEVSIKNGGQRVIIVSAVSAESGDNSAEIMADVTGEDVEIAFNARYLIDVLSVINTSKIALELTAASSPGVIRPIGDDTFIHVIMPMHITK